MPSATVAEGFDVTEERRQNLDAGRKASVPDEVWYEQREGALGQRVVDGEDTNSSVAASGLWRQRRVFAGCVVLFWSEQTTSTAEIRPIR